MVVALKPFADRTAVAEPVQTMIGGVFGAARQIRTANVIAFNLPPIIGLSTSGGFEYDLEALQGQDPTVMGGVAQGLISDRQWQQAIVTRLHHFLGVQSVTLYLDIDRAKAAALGVNVGDIFNVFRTALGGTFINNFNLYGRTWRGQYRGRREGSARQASRSGSSICEQQARRAGAAAFARLAQRDPRTTGRVTRYNNCRRASRVQDISASRRVLSAALTAMAATSDKSLPAGYSYEWTGTAYQEYQANGQTGVILSLAISSLLSLPRQSLGELDHPGPGIALRRGGRVQRLCRHHLVAGLVLDLYAQSRAYRAHRPGELRTAF